MNYIMSMTVGRESFLIYTGNVEITTIEQQGYKENNNKEPLMMVFISPIGQETLRSAFIWFGDRTFKMCPEPFTQIYTVFGMRKGYISQPAVLAVAKQNQGHIQAYVEYDQERDWSCIHP